MKQLCLLLILANVFLFLWEYREGGFNAVKVTSTQVKTPGVETILLANEVEKDTNIQLPKLNQEEQPLYQAPENKVETELSVKDEKPISSDHPPQTAINPLP
jgi:hypothetical protein